MEEALEMAWALEVEVLEVEVLGLEVLDVEVLVVEVLEVEVSAAVLVALGALGHRNRRPSPAPPASGSSGIRGRSRHPNRKRLTIHHQCVLHHEKKHCCLSSRH